MKAMILRAANTPFILDKLQDPVPGPGEAIAKVLACGAGLTIQHVKAGRSTAEFPRIIGHEITAEIIEVGAGVTALKAGDPVTAYYYLSCGYCRWCKSGAEPLCENTGGNVGKDCDGGYADFIKLPEKNFIKLPQGLDYKSYPAETSVITDAIATPVKVLKRARVKEGETVAVIGAGGGLGIHMLMMAKWAGARVIAIDIVKNKFKACRQAGAHEVINAVDGSVAEKLIELTSGDGIDVVIDFVSSASTLEAGAGALGRRGRLVTLGGAGQTFKANSQSILLMEQELLGSRYVTRTEISEAFDLVASGEIWPMVTDIRPLEEAEALHESLENGEITGRAALLIN